jgi:hypothetical protein
MTGGSLICVTRSESWGSKRLATGRTSIRESFISAHAAPRPSEGRLDSAPGGAMAVVPGDLEALLIRLAAHRAML